MSDDDTPSGSSDIADGRRLLARYQRFAEAGRWRRILNEGRALLPGPLIGRQLVFRLMAALELKDDDEIAGLVATVGHSELAASERIRLAGRLWTAQRSEDAWTVLAPVARDQHRSRIAKLASSIAHTTSDSTVRIAASNLAADLSQQSSGPTLVAAVHPLRTGRAEPHEPQGHIELVQSRPLLSTGLAAFEKLIVDWDATLAVVEPPSLREFHDVVVGENGDFQSGQPDADGAIPFVEGRSIALLTPTRGFFHWFCETIQALACEEQERTDTARVLIKKDYAPFQIQTLDLLGISRDRIVLVEGTARCETLLRGPRSLKNFKFWPLFKPIYETLLAAAVVTPTKRSIYVSRRDTTRRVLTNELEVEKMLAALGIATVSLSDQSLAEQMGLMRTADFIVAPHGAGLSHIVYADPGIRIIELLPARLGWESIRFNFARISRLRGHHHTVWLENSNPLSHSWSVDLPALQRFVGQALLEHSLMSRDGTRTERFGS